MFYEKQIERHAIAAFVQYGVKLNVPLSAAAKRELGRIRRTVAGLRELEVAYNMQRNAFESVTDFHARVLDVRTRARNAQLQLEAR
ncbi:MAG TPA: hypothetical protein VIY48_21465 [Candidatus Paceibacterota bacterium]